MFEDQQVPFIRVRNLTMDFQGERALDNISFDISQGEILGIIGRSGSGKTVLMHLLRDRYRDIGFCYLPHGTLPGMRIHGYSGECRNRMPQMR